MTALAAPSDVIARLGRDLTAPELRRIEALLDDASAAVRSVCGGDPFERATTTTRLRIRDGQVRLPLAPVNDVISVKWPDPDHTDVGWFFWEGLDVVTLWRQEFGLPSISATPYLRAFYRVVDVEYDHGYDNIPAVVVGIVASVTARALGVQPDQSDLASQSIEGFSESWRGQSAAGGFALLPDELKALEAASTTNTIGSIPIVASL